MFEEDKENKHKENQESEENERGGTPPKNYRLHFFHLFGRNIEIGGMAGPHNNKDINALFTYLREDNRTVLIGLHDELNQTEIAREASATHGFDYYHFPMKDFGEGDIPLEVYDNIYNTIKQITREGKQATIHCGVGDGRTGTALAALKLRELIENSLRMNIPLETEPIQNAYVYLPYIDERTLCTLRVKQAIEAIREHRRGIYKKKSGSFSVETKEDVATLMAYERLLLKRIEKYMNKSIKEDKKEEAVLLKKRKLR